MLCITSLCAWFEICTDGFILYETELGNKAVKATKNIYCVKSDGTVDHSIEARWFKKFCLDWKNLDDQTRSDRPKSVVSEAVLLAIEAN